MWDVQISDCISLWGRLSVPWSVLVCISFPARLFLRCLLWLPWFQHFCSCAARSITPTDPYFRTPRKVFVRAMCNSYSHTYILSALFRSFCAVSLFLPPRMRKTEKGQQRSRTRQNCCGPHESATSDKVFACIRAAKMAVASGFLMRKSDAADFGKRLDPQRG